MYSIALVAITAAAAFNGDLRQGLVWMSQPGTFDELSLPLDQRTWSVSGKWFCLVVFSSMGFFGSSCSAAITKNFGALTMSITSTARKAMTLFLSFFFFGNVCTTEHLLGIFIFITALTAKSLRRRGDGKKHKRRKHRATPRAFQQLELEMGMSNDTGSVDGRGVLIPTKSRSDEYENLIRRTASHESGGNGAAAAAAASNSIDPRDVHIV
jgi:UAA transporter family